jgi:hypothetical protein
VICMRRPISGIYLVAGRSALFRGGAKSNKRPLAIAIAPSTNNDNLTGSAASTPLISPERASAPTCSACFFPSLKLAELMRRELRELPLVVLLIDGALR